jgi:DNA-binding beta-propeller fold protein YncE
MLSIHPIIKALPLAAAGFAFAVGASAEMRFEHVMSIGTKGDGEGQFGYVEDFAFSKDGHLLVTDAAHAHVQVFDKTTGKFISRFGGKGDDDHNLDKPEGISVAPNGDIYVADYNTGDVKIYSASFEWKKTFSEYGSEPGQNIKSEFTDIRDGKYYMPEAGNHRVSVWDLEGNFLFLFGGKGDADGQMNNPESSKFNSEGKLYVADLKNDRVQVFDAEGKFLFKFGTSGSGEGQLKAPAGIGFDKHDNVYVSEIGNDRISVFDKDGNFLTTWGSSGSADGQFGNLHGLIVDAETGWVYVADTANDRIQVFRPAKGSS